ncbi:hypothetical protein Tdes44962_MAKER02419, partial [Teratosphaeria destructans]
LPFIRPLHSLSCALPIPLAYKQRHASLAIPKRSFTKSRPISQPVPSFHDHPKHPYQTSLREAKTYKFRKPSRTSLGIPESFPYNEHETKKRHHENHTKPTMAGVRDPAFWKRFSYAVHLDEEQGIPRHELKNSDTWLARQQRKTSRRAWVCPIFWLLFFGVLAAVVIVIIWALNAGAFEFGTDRTGSVDPNSGITRRAMERLYEVARSAVREVKGR